MISEGPKSLEGEMPPDPPSSALGTLWPPHFKTASSYEYAAQQTKKTFAPHLLECCLKCVWGRDCYVYACTAVSAVFSQIKIEAGGSSSYANSPVPSETQSPAFYIQPPGPFMATSQASGELYRIHCMWHWLTGGGHVTMTWRTLVSWWVVWLSLSLSLSLSQPPFFRFCMHHTKSLVQMHATYRP